MAAIVLTVKSVHAQSSLDDYGTAVHRALSLVQFAEKGDRPSVDQAIQVLQALPGPRQSEILADLQAPTPRLGDADQRLQALSRALQQEVDTPDPAAAQRQLHDVLAMPRYAGMTTGPSLLERIVGAVLNAIARFLRWLGVGNLQLNIPVWFWFAFAVTLILLIILWPLRTAITRGGRQAQGVRAAARPPSMDFFARADRLAAAGDYAGAIRALAGAVAVRLNGERAWDQSPYTVRELFSRSDNPDALQSLLRLFEETSYGQRAADHTAFASASRVADSFRSKAA